jgi:hypothetical protein
MDATVIAGLLLYYGMRAGKLITKESRGSGVKKEIKHESKRVD